MFFVRLSKQHWSKHKGSRVFFYCIAVSIFIFCVKAIAGLFFSRTVFGSLMKMLHLQQDLKIKKPKQTISLFLSLYVCVE